MSKGFNLEKSVRRIEDKISKITIESHKREINDKILHTETWVKVGLIKKLTGWNKYQLREARQNGWIKMKWNEQGIFYLLESLNDVFIKK